MCRGRDDRIVGADGSASGMSQFFFADFGSDSSTSSLLRSDLAQRASGRVRKERNLPDK